MSKTSSTSKSALIRELFTQGKSISAISKELDSNYSFVYSVVQTHCLKNHIEMHTHSESQTSKSDEIRRLYESGLTIGEVAKQLNSNYSFVWTVCNKFRTQK